MSDPPKPDLAEFLFDAARRRAAANDPASALRLLDELLRAAPHHEAALLLFAELQLDRDPAAAAAAAASLLRRDPGQPAAMNLRARALSAMGRHDEALDAFRAIAAVAPSGTAEANHAVALLRCGRPHEAVAAAERAVVLDPAATLAHAALGHAHMLLRQAQAAVEAFAAALRLQPDNVDALQGIARAHQELGRPSAAIAALLQAETFAPRSSGLSAELAALFRASLQREAARAALRRSVAAPARLSDYSALLFDMQYDPAIGEAEAAAEAKRWGTQQMSAVRPAVAPPPERDRDRDPHRPLRVGYVSADFYRHPVGWLGAAPIAAHDKSAVSVHLYANQTGYDSLTLSLQRAVENWVPILGLDDEAVAARIAADRIDVLVDLSGHTAGNRLAVFARRPAPIQVTWLGYAATTGLPTIDYMLLDEHHLAPGDEGLMLERVVRLPGTRFCYAPPDYADEVRRTPAAAAQDGVTFASFNSTSKLNDAVISLWSRVLAAVPRSRLLLKWRSLADPSLQAGIRKRFARHGIDNARIAFEGHSPHRDMLQRYNDVDIALDPFPFCGGLTSCEALWMGVPVVTLPGIRPLSRQTHAVLRVIGRDEWSADSADDYVAIAARLASDPSGRAEIRRSLPDRMRASPLCDAAGFARNLERAYRAMWFASLGLR